MSLLKRAKAKVEECVSLFNYIMSELPAFAFVFFWTNN